MVIANVVQRGLFIYVYDEKSRQLCSITAGHGPNDGLKGYSPSTVKVKRAYWTITHNEKGRSTHQKTGQA